MKRLILPFFPGVVVALLCATQLADVTWGARAFRALPWVKFLLNVLIHGFFVTFFVIGPLAQIIYPKMAKRSEFGRMGVACVYVLVPLFAYAFFLSQVQDFAALQEIFVSTVPIVVAGLILYEFERSFAWLAITVGVGTFIPFYLFNDILGPFPVLVQFVPSSAYVGIIRALAAWLPVFVATLWVEPKTDHERMRFHASGSLEIFCLAFFVHLIAPLIAVATKSPLPLHPIQDAWWVSYLLIAFFLYRGMHKAYGFTLALSGVLGVAAVVRLATCVAHPSDAVWSVLGAQYYFVSAFVLIRLAIYLLKLQGVGASIKIIKPHAL